MAHHPDRHRAGAGPAARAHRRDRVDPARLRRRRRAPSAATRPSWPPRSPTLSPFMIFYSAEARGYGVLMACVLLSTMALLRALEDAAAHAGGCVRGVRVPGRLHPLHVDLRARRPVRLGLVAHPRARRPLLLGHGRRRGPVPPVAPEPPGGRRARPPPDILSSLSPLERRFVRLSLGHWGIGYPLSRPSARLPRAARSGGPAAAALMSRVHDRRGRARPGRGCGSGSAARTRPGRARRSCWRSRHPGRRQPAERRRHQRLQHPELRRVVALPRPGRRRADPPRPPACGSPRPRWRWPASASAPRTMVTRRLRRAPTTTAPRSSRTSTPARSSSMAPPSPRGR